MCLYFCLFLILIKNSHLSIALFVPLYSFSYFQNKESDVGIGSFSVTHARYQVIDFSVPFYEESSAILTPAPVRGNQSSAFIKPFHLQVWLILIAILGLLPLIMWVQSKLIGKESSPIKKRDTSILFFYGVLLTQC